MLHFRQWSVNAARGSRGTARVALAATLLWNVQAHAAPRGKKDVSSQPVGLVTRDPAQIDDAVAGTPPTAILAITPVPAKVGSYPPGTSIVGNELRAYIGGFRAWFEVHLSRWDPNRDGVPPLVFWQAKVNATGYLGVNAIPANVGVDLAPAVVPCSTDAECVAAFGESWTKCESGICKAGYVDKLGAGRPDSWCAGGCDAGDANTTNPNYNWFAVRCRSRPDGGIVYYGGTLVLDIPAGAKGQYAVGLNHDETFLGDSCGVPIPIPIAAELGFTVNIVTGQCCFGLGTPDEGCVDEVLRSECGDDEPGPVAFTPDERCPPEGPDCAHVGACCHTLDGECEEDALEADCQGTHRVWSSGVTCQEARCAPDLGACCNQAPFGDCTDDVGLSDCRCASCTWDKLQRCAEIECAQGSIPTISEWGLGIMTLLLLTSAKVYFGQSKPTGRSIGSSGRG
jgi:hypothetical protein